jgi:hypothetical protein
VRGHETAEVRPLRSTAGAVALPPMVERSSPGGAGWRVREVPGAYTEVEAHVRAGKRDDSASAGQTLVAVSPRNSSPTRRGSYRGRIGVAASLAVRLSPEVSHP